MRAFAWVLVGFGLVIVVMAMYMTTADNRARRQAAVTIAARGGGYTQPEERSPTAGIFFGFGMTALGVLVLAVRRPGSPVIVVALFLLSGCTLPGYQGGPIPRTTQYTYPGRSFNPDTGLAHSPIPTVAEPLDGGVFVYGMVFHDGSSANSVDPFDTFAACETGRRAYADLTAERVKDGAAPVMTTKCFRAHDTGGHQTR
ncbi:MAG TPA: hypothetical protein VKA83_09295 [Methylomirabilota bacterium]|nr:hypothetical protein [Methylomirabilota bacterium]